MARASLTGRGGVRRWLRTLGGFDRNVAILLLFTLGKGFQLSIATIATNLYAHSLGYGLPFIGLLTGAPAVGSLVAAVPVGLLADRIGRKPLLIASGLLTPITLVAIGLSTSAPLLLGSSILNGVLASSYWVTNIPVLIESTPESRRVWVLALNNFLLLGVGALGGLIGGAVPELVGHLLGAPATSVVPLRWGVLAAALVVFLPALPLLALRETGRSIRAAPQPALVVTAGMPPAAPAREMAPMRKRAPASGQGLVVLFVKLLVPDALSSTGAGAALGLLQVFYLLRFSVQPGTLGVVFAVAGLLGGLTSLAAPRIVRRRGKLRTATDMQFLTVPVVLAMGFAPVFALAAAAQVLSNVLTGVFGPVYQAFTMEQVSARLRATLSGFYSVTWSIGFSLGPTVAGWLQARLGLAAAFVLSACCIGMAGLLLRLFFGERGPLVTRLARPAA